MSTLPVITNVSRVAFTWGPFEAVNVMHFHQETIDQDGLFGALDANLLGNMWACNSTAQHVTEVVITPLDGAGLTASYVPAVVTKWQGQQPGEIIPASSCVVSKRTVLRGRSFTGRSFIGPTTESGSSAGFNFSGVAAAMATAWTNFQAAMADDGVLEVVASYKLAAGTPVVQYLIRNAFGTMRPRQSRLAL